MAAEPIRDQVLDAVPRGSDPLPSASDLATAGAAFLQFPEVVLQAGQAEAPQRGRAVDVAQSPGRVRYRAAEDHSPFDVLRPRRQPHLAALRALPQLLPLRELDHWPLHDRIVIDAGPA